VDVAKALSAGIIMEDLDGIKQKGRGRSLNRRLNDFQPVRRLQLYVDYKARLAGLPIHYVKPKNTSSLCPICGGKFLKAIET